MKNNRTIQQLEVSSSLHDKLMKSPVDSEDEEESGALQLLGDILKETTDSPRPSDRRLRLGY